MVKTYRAGHEFHSLYLRYRYIVLPASVPRTAILNRAITFINADQVISHYVKRRKKSFRNNRHWPLELNSIIKLPPQISQFSLTLLQFEWYFRTGTNGRMCQICACYKLGIAMPIHHIASSPKPQNWLGLNLSICKVVCPGDRYWHAHW